MTVLRRQTAIPGFEDLLHNVGAPHPLCVITMEAFDPTPPSWTEPAVHAIKFACPTCGESTAKASAVWINRRAPVYTYNQKRKWQEFYHCECDTVWWAWSTDRPPSKWQPRQRSTENPLM